MKPRFKTIGAFCSLLLTGALVNPPNAEARPPRARELCGVIQAFDSRTCILTIQSPKRNQPATFAVKSDTRFIKDWKFTDSASLKKGMRACVYYRSPFFWKTVRHKNRLDQSPTTRRNTHEAMEVTAGRRQTRATCRKGSGATAPREPQQPVAHNRSRLGFRFTHDRGLLLAKSAGTKASGGTFAASASAGANEFSCRCHWLNARTPELIPTYKS